MPSDKLESSSDLTPANILALQEGFGVGNFNDWYNSVGFSKNITEKDRRILSAMFNRVKEAGELELAVDRQAELAEENERLKALVQIDKKYQETLLALKDFYDTLKEISDKREKELDDFVERACRVVPAEQIDELFIKNAGNMAELCHMNYLYGIYQEKQKHQKKEVQLSFVPTTKDNFKKLEQPENNERAKLHAFFVALQEALAEEATKRRVSAVHGRISTKEDSVYDMPWEVLKENVKILGDFVSWPFPNILRGGKDPWD